ncbi:sugar 3,4-ketoisomerase [Tessaracoccus lapidicaptus]|uniref:sugar 3,4-ketoisomerase n=1 Tax=Tessaracoccus lapidicaptus TaxID=1427523 RepID=UPI003DA7276E
MKLTAAHDLRGSLSALDFSAIPFIPQRFFSVYAVPSADVRGQHAHRSCHQFLVCLAGRVTCLVDDGARRSTHLLDEPSKGLYMPPMTWGSQFNYSPDAVLGVFASLPYDADDYIRDYAEFRELVSGGGPDARN